MRLTVRQVTYLLDQGYIKAQEFDSVVMRHEPFPSHLMLLQKAGLMTWDEVKKFESDVNWSVDNLLKETEGDNQLLGKYDHKFTQYLRERLAKSKNDSYPNVSINWNRIEYDIPELVKYLYVKRLSRFGINFKSKSLNDKGDEVYYFVIVTGSINTNSLYP